MINQLGNSTPPKHRAILYQLKHALGFILVKTCNNGNKSVAVDFGSLAGETGTGPSLCVLHDAVPYELLLEEGSCGMGRRMGEAMDKVEDSMAERKRDPRAKAAVTRVTEDCSPVVVDGGVLPLKGGERCPTGGRLRVLLLQASEMVVVEAETDR